MTDINITINDQSVLDDLISCNIQQNAGDYCNSVTLDLKSLNFWGECDPSTNFGELKIKVIIGDTTQEFLCEERESNLTKDAISFAVWGRSKQALLSMPYSQSIIDTDTTTNSWQTGDVLVEDLITEILTNYCPYTVTVNWNVENFAIYQDSFSASNQSPIEIISTLADVIGAEFQANLDGSLSINEYSVEEGDSVVSINDLDHIINFKESINYPTGYNAVTIYGQETPESEDLVPYEISVLDFCSDEAIANVQIYLNGSYIGVTDSTGIKSLGYLTPGTSYTLKMTKTGYQNSDVDALNNDSFTVQAAS